MIAFAPSTNILRYYFVLHGREADEVGSLLGAGGRSLVVVNESAQQTLEGVLAANGLSPAALSPPRLLQTYPSAAIYEVRRRD